MRRAVVLGLGAVALVGCVIDLGPPPSHGAAQGAPAAAVQPDASVTVEAGASTPTTPLASDAAIE